ncbi:hypothetical protein [Veronia nyctiphanis]|nr:hypothetical protein [Veronia nyctiphanis]
MENRIKVISSWKPNNRRESNAMLELLRYELVKHPSPQQKLAVKQKR